MIPFKRLNFHDISNCRCSALVPRSYIRPDHNDKRFRVHNGSFRKRPNERQGRILTSANFLASRAPLLAGHAVAALLVLEDSRYSIQLREDPATLWSPVHFGIVGAGDQD